jgi:hypothetical protein
LPVTLGMRVGRAAFKKGSIPRAVDMPPHSLMHCALPPSEPPDGEHPCCLRLAAAGGARPRGGWRSSVVARLQGFSSGSPAAVPHRRSPRMMTVGLVVGISKPGCGLCPTLSFKDVHHPRCGGGRAEPGFASMWAGKLLLPSAFRGESAHRPCGGGELRQRWTGRLQASSAVACLACWLSWLWRGLRRCLLPLGPGVAVRPPHRRLSRHAHRGTVQDAVRRMGDVRVLGLPCPHSGTTPPRGGRRRPVWEDVSGDLSVQAGAAAIRRRGAGAQVAAVVDAEVVVARGGCLRRRDRWRHPRSDLRLFGFDGLSSPLVWGRGRGPFHSSVCPEVIAAAV